MNYTKASREYLVSLNLNYDDTWRAVPAYLKVAKAEFVRERVFEHDNQILHDWIVQYGDGTYDEVSISPLQERPIAGRYFSRIPAALADPKLGFTCWKASD